MVDLISKTVPEGWNVYIKEHPDQFIMNKLNKGRHTYDYNDFCRLDNVSLIERSCSTFNLIDNAVTTATVTGTAAWESAVRGTPSIVFGYARFRLCDGIYHTTTEEEFKTAIEEMQRNGSVSKEKILRFARALEVVGYRGYTTGRQRRKFDVSREDNITNTVEAMHRFVVRQEE
jgi:hypothetical protein